MVAVTLTILFGIVIARVMGIARPFGILTAGAVAICGASAALAISSVSCRRARPMSATPPSPSSA